MPSVTAADATVLAFKDWGTGPPVVFSHGWPLHSDSWEGTMMYLANRGFRTIAHDRRGHGQSASAWNGHDMNTYADDLAAVMNILDVTGAVLVGFSAGGGEVARYIGRHGSRRVARVVLVAGVPPLMVQSEGNPGGLAREVFDALREESLLNRSQLYLDLAAGPFYGFNRPEARTSQGLIDRFWLQGMAASHRASYECIRAFSETDFTEDLRAITVPTLVIHGDDDQIVPIGASADAAARLLKQATKIVYAGAPHGLIDTHQDRLNGDLLAFIKP